MHIKYLAARSKKNSIDSTSTESVAAIKGANETKIKKTRKEKDEDKKKKSTVDKPNVVVQIHIFYCMEII